MLFARSPHFAIYEPSSICAVRSRDTSVSLRANLSVVIRRVCLLLCSGLFCDFSALRLAYRTFQFACQIGAESPFRSRQRLIDSFGAVTFLYDCVEFSFRM